MNAHSRQGVEFYNRAIIALVVPSWLMGGVLDINMGLMEMVVLAINRPMAKWLPACGKMQVSKLCEIAYT